MRTLRVRMGKVRFQGNRLNVGVIISNPNSDSVTVRSIVAECYVNGKKVGNVETFTPVVVAGNAKTTINLDVRIMALQVAEVIQKIADNLDKGISIELALTGAVNVDNKVLPIQLVDKIL